MAERFGLIGAKEVGRALRGLTAEVQTKVTRRATAAGAGLIKDRAIANVIASPSVDKGDLRDNIITKRITETDLTSEHIVTVRRRKVPHAGFVEFGTVKMPAEPYLRPALEGGKTEAANVIVRTLDEGIQAAARKAAK